MVFWGSVSFNVYFLMKEYTILSYGAIVFLFFTIGERGGLESGLEELIWGSRQFRRQYEEMLVEQYLEGKGRILVRA